MFFTLLRGCESRLETWLKGDWKEDESTGGLFRVHTPLNATCSLAHVLLFRKETIPLMEDTRRAHELVSVSFGKRNPFLESVGIPKRVVCGLCLAEVGGNVHMIQPDSPKSEYRLWSDREKMNILPGKVQSVTEGLWTRILEHFYKYVLRSLVRTLRYLTEFSHQPIFLTRGNMLRAPSRH